MHAGNASDNCRTGRSYISGTILQATVVATGASATTIVGVNLGVGLTISGTSQTAIYSTNGVLSLHKAVYKFVTSSSAAIAKLPTFA